MPVRSYPFPAVAALFLVNLPFCALLASVWWHGALWALLIGAGHWLGVRCGPVPAADSAAPLEHAVQAERAEGLQRFQALTGGVVPMWNRHLGLARQQMSDAIGNLGSGFSSLNQRLLGNDQAAGGELGSRAIAAIEQAEQRSEEHTSELQSRENLVCRLLH